MLCMRHKNGDSKKGEKNAPKRGFPCVFGGFSAIDKGGKLWYNRGEKKTWGRTPDGGSMNCVNCGSRLTFFNETDALWSGTDRALCASCRKKITPFLEEAAPDGNVQHLHDRRDALIARGVTPEGFAHLNDYCRDPGGTDPRRNGEGRIRGNGGVARPLERRGSARRARPTEEGKRETRKPTRHADDRTCRQHADSLRPA